MIGYLFAGNGFGDRRVVCLDHGGRGLDRDGLLHRTGRETEIVTHHLVDVDDAARVFQAGKSGILGGNVVFADPHEIDTIVPILVGDYAVVVASRGIDGGDLRPGDGPAARIGNGSDQ